MRLQMLVAMVVLCWVALVATMDQAHATGEAWQLSPSSLTFSAQGSQAVTIKNLGTTGMGINKSISGTGFSMSGCSGGTLGAGQTCGLTITYSGTADSTGSFTISNGATITSTLSMTTTLTTLSAITTTDMLWFAGRILFAWVTGFGIGTVQRGVMQVFERAGSG